MKIYIIPYTQTHVGNIVEIWGLDQNFFETEIIGDVSLEYGSIFCSSQIDLVCELTNFVTESQEATFNFISDLGDMLEDFSFQPEQIECAMLVQKEFCKDISLYIEGTEFVFPKVGNLEIRNGIFEIQNDTT
ncbi:MAG: hypothetical protein MRY57_02500 [Candidatus Pacebacteria bacterium]|nr:hypothetical protein [Candidatus Paceibacterota bacterium]